MSKEAIKRACKIFGGQTALAAALGVGRQSTVASWINRGKVPAEKVLKIEALTGVSRHDLRPDLYPYTQQTNLGVSGAGNAPG